jgi:hypothetical protein
MPPLLRGEAEYWRREASSLGHADRLFVVDTGGVANAFRGYENFTFTELLNSGPNDDDDARAIHLYTGP